MSYIINVVLFSTSSISSGVILDLQPESEMVAESEGVVEVCVSLSGELETSVTAMVFTVSGDATCEDALYNYRL